MHSESAHVSQPDASEDLAIGISRLDGRLGALEDAHSIWTTERSSFDTVGASFPQRVNRVNTLEQHLSAQMRIMQENIDALDADDAVAELQARISLQGTVLRDAIDSLYGYFEV